MVLLGHLLYSAIPGGGAGQDKDSLSSDSPLLRLSRRGAWVSRLCLGLLIVTGLLLLARWHVGLDEFTSGSFYVSRVGRLLVVKILGTVVLLTALLPPCPPGKYRAGLTLVAGLVVILCSVLLVR